MFSEIYSSSKKLTPVIDNVCCIFPALYANLVLIPIHVIFLLYRMLENRCHSITQVIFSLLNFLLIATYYIAFSFYKAF